MHIIYLSLMLASFSYAQSVNFDKILDLTIKNNKDLKQQQLSIDSSKLDIDYIDSISFDLFIYNVFCLNKYCLYDCFFVL